MKHASVWVLLVFLFSCASGHQQTSEHLRKFVQEKHYKEAIDYLQKSPLAEDNKSKLLYFSELGLLEHYRGNYLVSNQHFVSAKELLDELYTTRISNKMSSIISNDNADLYYGEKYEASLVYFYSALNFYLLGMDEKDVLKKKEYLRLARAEVLSWDSFLTEIKNERLGQALFKDDLLAKTFGALIHESQGTNEDNRIALQLYKDAQTVFFRNYNLYPTFNAAFVEFKKNFSILPNLDQKEIEGKYVLETEHTRAFKDFLSMKINSLTAKLSSKTKKSDGEISFLVQDGLISAKVPHKYEFPMQWGAHSSMAFAMGMGSKISFELPGIDYVAPSKIARLQAIQNGQVIKESPLSVISPISELAEQAINEHSATISAKTAARVAGKHIAALAASYAIYETGRQRNDGIMMLLASAGHASAVASINASEKADVRFWSTLPSSIRMGNITLPKGQYQFRAIFGDQSIDLGTHDVSPESTSFVMNRNDQFLPATNIARSPVQVVAPDSRLPASDPQTKTSSLPAGDCENDHHCPQVEFCSISPGELRGTCLKRKVSE